MIICPKCGEINKEGSKFCNECGSKIKIENQHNQNNNSNYSGYEPFEESRPAFGKFSKRMANKLENSKLMDKYLDFVAPKSLKFKTKHQINSLDRKIYKYADTEFLEVYDTIEDDFLKTLYILEYNKINGGANIIDSVAPASHLSNENEKRKFYLHMLNKVNSELVIEQQKEGFNKEEYYKKKLKELYVESLSNPAVPRDFR